MITALRITLVSCCYIITIPYRIGDDWASVGGVQLRRDWTPDGYQERRSESQEGSTNVSEVVYDGLPQTHILNTSSTWYSMLPVSEEWEVIEGLLG